MIPAERLIGRAGDGAPSPEEARLVIRAATQYLEHATGFVYGEPRDRVFYLTGRGTASLWLPGAPFEAPTVTEQLGAPTPVPITDFVVRGSKLVRTWPACWLRGREYAVTCRMGYLVGTGPELEQEAVLAYALELWRQSSAVVAAVASGLTGEELEDYRWEADGSGLVLNNVPQVMLDTINLRRRVAV